MRAVLLNAKREDNGREYLRRETEVRAVFKCKLYLRIKGEGLLNIQILKQEERIEC